MLSLFSDRQVELELSDETALVEKCLPARGTAKGVMLSWFYWGEERNTNKLSRRERNCACGRLLARILTESPQRGPLLDPQPLVELLLVPHPQLGVACLTDQIDGENDLQVTVSPVFSLSRRLRSSTPGSPGSTTVGPNHSQKKSLILAQKER
ncbi:hypothetical protein L1987_88022 [Smallanthus sonchifolius]|nr:hypothetical protein L1987_88022 [Smallanthus sonchifolius]